MLQCSPREAFPFSDAYVQRLGAGVIVVNDTTWPTSEDERTLHAAAHRVRIDMLRAGMLPDEPAVLHARGGGCTVALHVVAFFCGGLHAWFAHAESRLLLHQPAHLGGSPWYDAGTIAAWGFPEAGSATVCPPSPYCGRVADAAAWRANVFALFPAALFRPVGGRIAMLSAGRERAPITVAQSPEIPRAGVRSDGIYWFPEAWHSAELAARLGGWSPVHVPGDAAYAAWHHDIPLP